MSGKRFTITITSVCTLGVGDLWPDNDAPENPTDADVLELIDTCGGPAAVLSDWCLDEDLMVDVSTVGEGGERG